MRFKTSPRKTYPSDLTNDQWNILEPLLSPPATDGLGRPREVDLREVIKSIRWACSWPCSSPRQPSTTGLQLLAQVSPAEFPRRNSKDYERTIASSAAMIQVSQTHLMLRRLAPHEDRRFHYRARAA